MNDPIEAVRIHKSSKQKLSDLAYASRISMTKMLERLIDEADKKSKS